MTNCPECHVRHVFRLMIRMIMKCNQEMCTDLLAFTSGWGKSSARRSSDVGCATSDSLKWGPLLPNYIASITQQVREGEERGKDNVRAFFYIFTSFPM